MSAVHSIVTALVWVVVVAAGVVAVALVPVFAVLIWQASQWRRDLARRVDADATDDICRELSMARNEAYRWKRRALRLGWRRGHGRWDR